MSTNKKYENKSTRCVHAGQIEDQQFGGSLSPIYLSTSYEYMGVENKRYPRYFNTPNQEVIATKLAALEGAEMALPFASGMAAISTALLSLLKKGDHAIFQNEVYGGTYNLIRKEFGAYGLDYSFTKGARVEDFLAEIRPNTKVIYLETPSNPLLTIIDIERLAEEAKKRGILTVIDNTFASPINQNPIPLGVDLVVHSATKYLGGHSDITAGIVAGSKTLMEEILYKGRNLGGSLSDLVCYMLERSIKTLALRVEKHNENAGHLASVLQGVEGIQKVYYPGLESHAGHALAKRQMSGFGGMLSFELDKSIDPQAFLRALEMIKPSMSLAGVESTIIQPSETSHALMSVQDRAALGIDDGLMRLSVGIEDKEDIFQDIKQAIHTLVR